MPKIVDPRERRGAIADALFDVLREEGFPRVSLASIADRAGLAIGSVRHFLGSREELLRFAFDTIVERIYDRVVARASHVLTQLDVGRLGRDERLAATADILCELLPLDAVRRDEAVVWIEFETAARTDERLAETSRRAAMQTAELVGTILTSAQQRGALAATNLATESARLTALIDGLTLRCALHPETLSPALAREAVMSHLRALAQSATPASPEH